MAEDDSNEISIRRAKFSWPLKRHASLKRASDALKAAEECKGKKLEIVWKSDDEKDRSRGVKVGDTMAFIQSPIDASGEFQAPFQNVRL